MSINMTFIHNAIGLTGVAITILAFLLLNMRKIDPRRWLYSALNAGGSVLIIFSLCYAWNLSAWIMEFSWLLISLYGVYQALRNAH